MIRARVRAACSRRSGVFWAGELTSRVTGCNVTTLGYSLTIRNIVELSLGWFSQRRSVRSTRKGALHGGAASYGYPAAVLGSTQRGAQRRCQRGSRAHEGAMCSHTDAVSQCGFWGGVESGWAEVGERWEWVASQFVPGQGEVTSESAFLTVSGDMAYGVFIESWRGRFKGRPEPTELMIRATLIFRREDGEWKAVHRHGDNAVEKVSPS